MVNICHILTIMPHTPHHIQNAFSAQCSPNALPMFSQYLPNNLPTYPHILPISPSDLKPITWPGASAPHDKGYLLPICHMLPIMPTFPIGSHV